MRVLLVWQEIPETTKFYVLTDPTGAELVILAAAHGGLINATDNTEAQEAALVYVNFALTDPKYVDEPRELYAARFEFTGDVDFWLSRWFGNAIDEDALPASGPFDQVFVSGFLL